MSSATVFSLVTPSFNAAGMIEDTVRSVLDQSALRSGRARLQYVVRDGASTDDTLARVRAVVDEVGVRAGDVVDVVSEPDFGMYDGLAKGLATADGDIVAYLNAGDYYAPTCFDAVLDGMEASDAEWLTGMRVLYNYGGHVIDVRVPGPYRRRLLTRGFYGYRGKLGAIQQESTFWNARLHRTIDLERLRSFRLAGDFFLWRTFAEHADLYVLYTHLGGFRLHGGHLSEDMSAYRAEMSKLVGDSNYADWATATWDLGLQFLPLRLRKHLSGPRLLLWDRRIDRFDTARAWRSKERQA